MKNTSLLSVLFLLLFCGCSNVKCLEGTDVSKFYAARCKEMPNYCKYFTSAMNGELSGFLGLVEMNNRFFDGLSYEHGYVIINIIETIGEDKVLKWVLNGDVDIIILWAIIRTGWEIVFSETRDLTISMNETFPLLGEVFERSEK